MEAAQKFIFGSKLNIATLLRFIALRLHTNESKAGWECSFQTYP